MLRLLITSAGILRVNDSLNFKKAMDASIFCLNPCLVCNEEISFDDMVCEEGSFIPIQFKKVNEVFNKLKLCNVETDDNDVNCCKRCYIELNNKSDIPSFWKGKRNMHHIIVVHIYCT
jgi:hypothetical protein